ncbi:hypothetical protein PI125_g20740 [Phytophthora idaei]|nr:hypothetical protein PI125_g20740 [Phytophthora idaei]
MAGERVRSRGGGDSLGKAWAVEAPDGSKEVIPVSRSRAWSLSTLNPALSVERRYTGAARASRVHELRADRSAKLPSPAEAA